MLVIFYACILFLKNRKFYDQASILSYTLGPCFECSTSGNKVMICYRVFPGTEFQVLNWISGSLLSCFPCTFLQKFCWVSTNDPLDSIFSSVRSLSCVQLIATPWTAACQQQSWIECQVKIPAYNCLSRNINIFPVLISFYSHAILGLAFPISFPLIPYPLFLASISTLLVTYDPRSYIRFFVAISDITT